MLRAKLQLSRKLKVEYLRVWGGCGTSVKYLRSYNASCCIGCNIFRFLAGELAGMGGEEAENRRLAGTSGEPERPRLMRMVLHRGGKSWGYGWRIGMWVGWG